MSKRNTTNTDKIKGVINLSTSEQHYVLERKYPCDALVQSIEQYWFVYWDLRDKPPHIQRNLPDPCVNLFFDQSGAKLLGPVTKSYSYKLSEQGHIVGIKFKPAGFRCFASPPMTCFANKYTDLDTVFSNWDSSLVTKMQSVNSLEEAVTVLEPFLIAQNNGIDDKTRLANEIIEYIKSPLNATQVKQVATHFKMSVRTLQRLFESHIGVSAKWIIRKYRLHDVLDHAENNELDWLTLSLALGYTDQSHFIKDFKELIGVTPRNYRPRK